MSVDEGFGACASCVHVDHVRGGETLSVDLALEVDTDNGESANPGRYAVRCFAEPRQRGRHPPSTLERTRPASVRLRVDGDTRSTDHP